MSESRFCSNCGNRIPSEGAFCDECGAPIDSISQTVDAPRASSDSANTSSNSVSKQQKKKGKRPLIAILVIAIFVIFAAVAALFLVPNLLNINSEELQVASEDIVDESNKSDAISDVVSPSEGNETNGANDAQTGENVEAVSSTLSSQDASVTHSADPVVTEGLSINNAEDRFLVNRYLSNFSEIGPFMNGYRSNSTSKAIVAIFGAAHTVYNAPNSYTTVSNLDSQYLGLRKMSFSTVEKYVKLFLKRDIKTSDVCSTDDVICIYKSGFVYFSSGNGSPLYSGIACANRITSAGGNRYNVNFVIYGPLGLYEVEDESLYRMSESQLASSLYYQCTGTAVIESGYDNETAPFKLISYDLNLE